MHDYRTLVMSLPSLPTTALLPEDEPRWSEREKKEGILKHQRWLLFLRHCARCKQSEHECSLKTQCKYGKQLLYHLLHCAAPTCDFPRCSYSKKLLKHHQKCHVRDRVRMCIYPLYSSNPSIEIIICIFLMSFP